MTNKMCAGFLAALSVTLLAAAGLILDSGARAASTTFAENGQGDVLIAWENEAFFCLEENPGQYEIVVSSASILCQPTVAVVDAVVDEDDTREIATEYLNYLYSDEAQRLEVPTDGIISSCTGEYLKVHSVFPDAIFICFYMCQKERDLT